MQLLKNQQSLVNIEYEIVWLSGHHLETCKGCRICIDKGEELCPMKDGRNSLFTFRIGQVKHEDHAR